VSAELPAAVGRYRVQRLLGQGGMGVVLAVHDPATGRDLALKLILGAEADGEALARFWREAELLARVRHRSVVRIHELGRAPQGPFLVQEVVAGDSLLDLARMGVEPRQAARWARDLADAVAAVHAAGVLHRDLKPENVIVRPDGIPVLLDFGLAREAAAAGQLTRTGQAMGTPAYMSPEQARGESPRTLDARTDVYGLGAILFELLAGRPPFTGASLMSVLLAVAQDEPRWPSADRADVPRELEAIVRRAMAKDRAARFPDAAALRDALDGFLAEDAAQPARGGERRTAAALAVVAGAVFAAVAALVAARVASRPALAESPAAEAVAAPGRAAPSAAAPEPAAARAPAAAPSPVPGPGPAPGDLYAPDFATGPLEFHFAEASAGYRVGLRTWLRIATEPAGPALEVTATIERVVLDLRFGPDGGQALDTAGGAAPSHPLAGIARGVGEGFRLRFDPRTGEVAELSGLSALFRERVAAGIAELYARRLGLALADGQVHAAFRALLHVAPDGALPWVEQRGRRGQRRFELAADDVPLAVPLITLEYGQPQPGRCRLRGSARLAEGRPRVVEVEQTVGQTVTRWGLREGDR